MVRRRSVADMLSEEHAMTALDSFRHMHTARNGRLNVTNSPADPKALAEFRADLIKIRDEAAGALNRLDADPPTSEDTWQKRPGS
jgi:hypothetical protein